MTIVDLRGKLQTHATRTWKTRSVSDVLYVSVHQQMGTGDAYNVARYHVGPNHISKRGCPGICYHYSIGMDGTIYMLNDLTSIVWSTGRVKPYRAKSLVQMKALQNINNNSVSIMLQGNFDGVNYKGSGDPSDIQLHSLLRLRHHLLDHLGIPVENFLGHCHFNKKACPGFNAQDFIEMLWGQDASLYIPEPEELTSMLSNIKDKFKILPI